jgi:diguanylate cyclase (GGDEF)-like protein
VNPDLDGPASHDSRGRLLEVVRPVRMVWIIGAISLLVVGSMGAFLAARTLAGNSSERSQRSFAVLSADTASLLKLGIQHEQDLVISAAGFVVGNPDASEAAFRQWADSVSALQRYPELIGFGESVIVPASQLSAFATHEEAHLVGPVGPKGTFQVVPPGDRALYCFSRVQDRRAGSVSVPAGYDFCAGSEGAAALASRDSGLGAYAPITFGHVTSLAVETPIYKGGVVPSKISARRATFIGWIGMSVIPSVLLDAALDNHPGTAVSLQYGGQSSKVEFSAGRKSPEAQRAVINLNNGWTVETFGPAIDTGVLSNEGALALLVVGSMLSALLGVLVFVLGTGRARALSLVSQKIDELRHQTLHDGLTGLPNRALIMDRIEQVLARSRRNGTIAAAMYIDLDNFKNVNDTLGHAAGDQLLIAVSVRLTSALRDADTIGRMGGDEFVVLIDGDTTRTRPELVAERLLEVMRQPFYLEAAPNSLTVTASVGIALGDRGTAGELLRDADVALYLAKGAGKNCHEVFRPEMDTNIRRRYELEFDLQRALENDQFRLVYQPIYDLNDLTMIGVEALLRWDHPTSGVVEPDTFIPLLESSGQIIQVGRWVLIEACRQAAEWHALGSLLGLSVNVSGRQFEHDQVLSDVREALELSGLEPSALTIEVTETVLMQNTRATTRRLADLKTLGIQLAIDDFGTGYSSLAYLHTFPLDCLKIDRSFVKAIGTSSESKALVRTLVELGRSLGFKTLAEGVETTEQIDELRNESVDRVQGFLMARPLDPETISASILHLPDQVVSQPTTGTR